MQLEYRFNFLRRQPRSQTKTSLIIIASKFQPQEHKHLKSITSSRKAIKNEP